VNPVDRIDVHNRAALKAEVNLATTIVARAMKTWSPGARVHPSVNHAFRRVLEIGCVLHASHSRKAAPSHPLLELEWRATRHFAGRITEYYVVLPSGGTALIRECHGAWSCTMQVRGTPDEHCMFATAYDAQAAVEAQEREREAINRTRLLFKPRQPGNIIE
jgi:hypothetical protein